MTHAMTHALPLRRLIAATLAATGTRRMRRRLATLDDHMLRDIGVTRDQANAEAALPFWNAPAVWRG